MSLERVLGTVFVTLFLICAVLISRKILRGDR